MLGRSLTVVILFTSVLQKWGAKITCNSGCLLDGTSHKITCTSLVPNSCVWYKGSSKILTCPTGGLCVPEAAGYTGLRISDTHYVLQIEAVTASTYQCRCGAEQSELCPITTVTAVPVGTLGATCSSDVITCSGITDHGTPAVTLELKHGSTILASTTTGGSVSSTQSGSAGKTYTCAVTGTGSECLSPNSVDVTCSGATLSGSLPYSIQNQFFQFTCTRTGSITSNLLTFRRSTSTICTIIYPGDASQCGQFAAVPGYSCYCGGSGVFYLNISSVSLQDEDRWRCEVNSQSSNSVSLPVYCM